MPYYIRCFCSSGDVPTVRELTDWLAERDVKVHVQGDWPAAKLQARDWQRLPLLYKSGRLPLVLECHRVEQGKGDTDKSPIQPFIELVGTPGKSHIKRRIIKRLQETQFIVAIDLPADDMDDAGYDANGQILTYFDENNGALIHAEREGFYERSNMVLPTKP